MKYKNLLITRKAQHERCDIRRAASICNTSMARIEEELDRFGTFETKLFLVSIVKDRILLPGEDL